MSDFDLITIGAGPAGMSAARVAAEGGLRVLLLDEQARPGGQIYRNAGQTRDARAWLGAEYAAGARLVDALEHPGITARFGATVWRLDAGPRVVWSEGGASHSARAPHILLAGGAQERPVPFPGWTQPGVMTAGAAQILMKTAGMLPRDAVLAGSGPLLYLVAAQMIDAGAPPKALVETQTPRMMLRALPHLPKALFAARTLLKGLGLMARIRKAGVRRYTAATDLAADTETDGTIRFSFRSGGAQHSLTCALVLTHQGVIPSTHISRAAGIAHTWNAAQVAFKPVHDIWGATDRPGLYVAGDGAGIGGADAATAAGQLAALDILRSAGRISADARNQRAALPRATLFRARAIRPFLDAAYAPSAETLSPPDETIICRCEEITAGAVRQSVKEGAQGHRQIKTSLRVGMGACQGLMCDATVRGVLCDGKSACMGRIAPPRARTPIKPITLGELAALTNDCKETA
ncbi:NAD(P)/FAD-dependent oxidoreductase [Roseovarius dicentrarchi]|uniref:FAD/NAD(P)-dependent oxidoreductase n=1 Tax=Roseovarius dicentrarchi TaxID=2250573 RepID=UPI000DE93528|nr:FAD/NAD(P)-binding oxidoreductase [Roseovarius dicentrarchi]